MRILHTSDWHIGRTFHGHATQEHLEQVLVALTDVVRANEVDVVLVAGDVFDHSAPKAAAFNMLNRAVARLREAGALVVLTSGNHDSPSRLGHLGAFAARGGVHVRTDLAALAEPVLIEDDDDAAAGPVALYGLPYLHPALLAATYSDFEGTTHAEALEFAMGLVRADHAARGGRWVVAAHCFAQNLGPVPEVVETREPGGLTEERDITRGGLDLVPVSVFDGPDYVALGHIHGRTTLSERVRYSGAPLRYSFGERDKPRGAWLIELGGPGEQSAAAAGAGSDAGAGATSGAGAPIEVTWVDLPVPRGTARLEGTLAELLAPGAHEEAREAWVEAVLTDDVHPHEAMRAMRTRYPHTVSITHAPANRIDVPALSYAERVRGRSEAELVGAFLAFVRDGHGPTPAERSVLAEAMAARDLAEAAQ